MRLSRFDHLEGEVDPQKPKEADDGTLPQSGWRSMICRSRAYSDIHTGERYIFT